jgi:CRP-like cAMP-binding protein
MQTQIARTAPEFRAPIFQSSLQIRPFEAEPDPFEALGTVVTVLQGGELYAQGDDARHWYQVRSGVLRTCKLLSDGRRQIDDFLFPGDFFGFEIGAEHCFAAEAVTAATVIRYARGRLDSATSDNPRMSARLLQITLRQLGKAHERLMLLGRKTAEERVASFLLEMLKRSPAGSAVDLAMSRIDIADYLGLTIETVSRTFSALKRDGVIALHSAHHVAILDHDALEDLSGDI